MSKDTGGPAFPLPMINTGPDSGIVASDDIGAGGMTLRDYFAAKAMLIVWKAYDEGYCGGHVENTNELIAVGAYQIADAMLEARK